MFLWKKILKWVITSYGCRSGVNSELNWILSNPSSDFPILSDIFVILVPIFILSVTYYFTPAPSKVERGHTGFTPDVCPSVCRQGFQNFLKKVLALFISYLASTIMGWVSWPLFIFVILPSFLALCWPNIWPKMGIPELFEKTIDSIHFIPGIYPYGVSLLTPVHFRDPSLIFGPLVAKNLAENGVSRIFFKKLLVPFITWYLAFTVSGIFGWGYFWMKWVVIRAGVYCTHLWAQLVSLYYHFIC